MLETNAEVLRCVTNQIGNHKTGSTMGLDFGVVGADQMKLLRDLPEDIPSSGTSIARRGKSAGTGKGHNWHDCRHREKGYEPKHQETFAVRSTCMTWDYPA